MLQGCVCARTHGMILDGVQRREARVLCAEEGEFVVERAGSGGSSGRVGSQARAPGG